MILQVTVGKHNAITFIGMHDAIRVVMEFLLIFGETNFMEVLKIHEICEIYSPRYKNTLRYFKPGAGRWRPPDLLERIFSVWTSVCACV